MAFIDFMRYKGYVHYIRLTINLFYTIKKKSLTFPSKCNGICTVWPVSILVVCLEMDCTV